ncbi:hypothetical protein CC78DRAFT_553963 [Lojkania enalia]|uniref:Uncharacterized protein n=1 Tax=Lojkania enalia TaxID=147567 RepID=A0A9P4K6R6_9PLEO|nr:hypothetical protein CC78DRAFT_553963 [Didymosphaeria enalia]
MYRRGDPRWNRTIQHITENIEQANETAQVSVWNFGHNYVNPCLSSISQGFKACVGSCFPSRNDRRRNRGRSRGRAELSFDFYDDWEYDENDGLLGWGNDGLDRLLAGSSNYGTVSQPGRQRAMSYGTRNRDNRYNSGRRKSTAHHNEGPDPTIIPSSSYFGFLGRLPFKIGGKVLRYKPSAADLTEHPGQSRRSLEEEQPLIEDSDEDTRQANENKGHRRQRSHTSASGNTTDSLSSRGDIFPSEDELDDAVPLDDEFTVALERRSTSQLDEASSGRARSGSKRPAASRLSTRTASSRNTQGSGRRRRSNDDAHTRKSASTAIDEVPSLSDLKQEEERVRLEEEREIERKRHDAQQLAVKRGTPSPGGRIPRSPSPQIASPMTAIQNSSSPLIQSAAVEPSKSTEAIPFPTFDPQTAPDSGSFHVDESDYSSIAPTPNRPLSLKDEPREVQPDSNFIPARLPHFDNHPD